MRKIITENEDGYNPAIILEWLKEWATSVCATEIAEFSEKKLSKSLCALWLAYYIIHFPLFQYEVNVTDSLERQVGHLLHERGLKLVLAESCTGGLLGSRITDVPGSSEYFLGGVVAYAYEAKVALLNVSWDTLNTKGAVSSETVLEMARGIRNAMNADIAVSVSGIAGPGGGTSDKPVGTTWIGLVTGKGEWAEIFYFSGNREENKNLAVEAALKMLLDYLQRDQA